MKLGYTILYVENVAHTLDFYERAFGLPRKMLHESGDYAELETGTTVLSFLSHAQMQRFGKSPALPDPARPTFEIALVTDDVPAALDRAVAAGARLVTAATPMPWGQTIAYVSDINGFLIEICTPVGS